MNEAPERELGLEHGLALQPGALPDEQMVVVSLEGGFVDVKHLVAKMQGHAAKVEDRASQIHTPCCKAPRTGSHSAASMSSVRARTHTHTHSVTHLPSDHLTMRALLSFISLPSSSRFTLHLMVFSTCDRTTKTVHVDQKVVEIQ